MQIIEDDDNKYSDWDNDEEQTPIKSIEDLTLYELMGTDHFVSIRKDWKFGYNVTIENDDGELVIEEKQMHPMAMDCAARFCRRFLEMYTLKKHVRGIA